MKLIYNHAIVSYCSDLTSGNARHLPVAVLLIGRVERGPGVAAILVPSVMNPPPDEITSEVLRELPRFIQRHVDEALAVNPTQAPLSILEGLHEKLRNSLSVSQIHQARSVEYSGLGLSVTLSELYKEALEDSGWKLLEEPQEECPEPPATSQCVSLGSIPLASTLYELASLRAEQGAHCLDA